MTRKTSSAQKIRLGVIGAGFGGYGLAPAFALDDRFDVIALATQSQESAQRAIDRFGLNTLTDWRTLVMSPDIDAIAVAVPPDAVYEICAAAFDQGKHVLAEKQLPPNFAEAARLAEMAEMAGLANMVDFIFPELETWRQAKELLNQGAIGTVRHAFLDWRMESFDHRHGKAGWKTDRSQGGGALNHFASHSLYNLEWLFGPIAKLSATLSTAQDCRQTGDTMAALSIVFEQGTTLAISLSNAATMGCGHRIEISGTDGSLVLANATPNPIEGFELWCGSREQGQRELLATEHQRERPEDQDPRVLPVARMVNRFGDWIVDGIPAKPDFKDGARVQALLEAAAASNRSGGGHVSAPPD